MLDVMNTGVRKEIENRLDTPDEVSGNDARILAEEVGMECSAREAAWNGRGRGGAQPTKTIMDWWIQRKNPPVLRFIQIMQKMERLDVVSIIYEAYPHLKSG